MFGPARQRIKQQSRIMPRVAALVLIILGGTAFYGQALADVSVEPTRVVLSLDAKIATIDLRNEGRKRQIITPVWTELIQGEDAGLYPSHQAIAPGDLKDIRIWPASAELAPGKTARFTLFLDPKAQLTGEVRHHLRFNFDPVRGSGPQWGVVIPVFTRREFMDPEVQILDVRGDSDSKLYISMHNRGGNSPHGHLVVFDRDRQKIAELYNVNLYTFNQRVTFSLPLEKWPVGDIVIRYLGDDEFSGLAFAEGRFPLTPDPVQ